MGEESASSLVISQTIDLDGIKSGIHSEEKTRLVKSNSTSRYRRASLGSYNEGDSSGGSSSGKTNSPSNSQDAIPHYLRASTGSCHDFCKYGRKHTFVEKPWRPSSKRITKPPSDELVIGKSPIPLERKVAVVKPPRDVKADSEDLNPSPDSKAQASNPTEIIKHVPLPSMKVKASSERELASRKKMPQMPKVGRKSDNVSMKNSPVVEPIAPRVKSLPSSDASEGKTRRGRGNSNVNDGQTVVVSKASLENVLRPAYASSSSRTSVTETTNVKPQKNKDLKLVSPIKNQNRTQKATTVELKNAKVPEKTEHDAHTETVSIPLQPNLNGDVTALIPTQYNQSPKPASEEVDEGKNVEHDNKTVFKKNKSRKLATKNNEAPNLKQKKIVEGNSTRTLRKGVAVVPKGKESLALKLKFRRGKVVDLQSESNTPRKLRFRRGKLLVGNQDGKADGKRNFKKNGLVDDKDGASTSCPRKVVLRHQDVQNKKDTQVLLNNVIEETASKLVKSKKSKVKALVGAFETVISLRDSKPSAPAVSLNGD